MLAGETLRVGGGVRMYCFAEENVLCRCHSCVCVWVMFAGETLRVGGGIDVCVLQSGTSANGQLTERVLQVRFGSCLFVGGWGGGGGGVLQVDILFRAYLWG